MTRTPPTYHLALHETTRLWRVVSASGAPDAEACEATLRAMLGMHAPERTGAERREFAAWCVGLPGFHAMLHHVAPVTPYGKGRDTATLAGTLTRGQWRGVPVLPRGAPCDAVDTPTVSGYLWAMRAALGAKLARLHERTGERRDAAHREACHDKRRKGTDRRTEELRRKVRGAIRRMAEWDAAYCALRAEYRAKYGH